MSSLIPHIVLMVAVVLLLTTLSTFYTLELSKDEQSERKGLKSYTGTLTSQIYKMAVPRQDL